MYFAEALLQPEEQTILFQYLTQLNPKRILEIGSYKGGGTRLFHNAVPNAEIICIDPDPQFNEFENVHIIRQGTPQAFAILTGKFDFIFIDGNHSKLGCLSDLTGVLPFCHADTKVLLHDANYHEVASAIDIALADKHYANKVVLFESTQKDGEVTWGGLVEVNFSSTPNTRLKIGQREVEYRPGTFDRLIAYEMQEQYQEVDYKKAKTIIDIGGHAGYFVNMVLDRNPKVDIISVEMAKDNYELLKRNTKNEKRVHAIYAKVGYKLEDKFAIRWQDGNTGSGQLWDADKELPDNTLKLEVAKDNITIEDIFEGYDLEVVDVLKLDCEGSEFDILQNIQTDTTRHIRDIVGEYHSSADAGRELLETFGKLHHFTLQAFSNTNGLGSFHLHNDKL